MKIVTSGQMRAIEARSKQAGVSTDALMERAGLAVASRVRHHLGHIAGIPIVVLVGPGNNGGDGLVAARHLHSWGAQVQVYLCQERREPDPKLDIVRNLNLLILRASKDQGLTQLQELLESADMVVDSALGTGRSRPIKGLLKAIFVTLMCTKARRPELRLLALDLPSGLDADTGAVDPACPAADITVALGYPKVGFYTFPGAGKVGTVEIVDIGIPPKLDDRVDLELMTPMSAAMMLPHRPPDANKGTFGKTLVVAGSSQYIGAAYLAATAATRVGAGLVTLAIPQSLQTAVAAKAVEPTYIPLPESSPGVVSAKALALILDNLAAYDALLLGCGIGQGDAVRELVEHLLYSNVPLPPAVVDADGLNILSLLSSKSPSWWERFTTRAIITPHPGEMARLSGDTTSSIQTDRIGKAIASAVVWNKVVVLKGPHTVVALPNNKAKLSPFANPGLATAGTGDVLAGTIVGLLSQGLTLENAASLGVYLQGSAGERVRSELGETGMIASDLLTALPLSIKDLRRRN